MDETAYILFQISAMAIIDHFEVTILVDGKPATEYDDTESVNKSNDLEYVTKYVEVKSGSCFAFEFKVLASYRPEGEDGLKFSLRFDGNKVSGIHLETKEVHPIRGFTSIKDSISVNSESGWGRSKYSFADLETREIDLPVGSTS